MSTDDKKYVGLLMHIVALGAATALAWAGWVSLALVSVLQDVALISATQVATDKKLEVIVNRLQKEDNFLIVAAKDGENVGRQERNTIQPDAGQRDRALQ